MAHMREGRDYRPPEDDEAIPETKRSPVFSEEQARQDKESRRKEQLARKFFEIAESARTLVTAEAGALERGELTRSSLDRTADEIARAVWRDACEALDIDDDTMRKIMDDEEGRVSGRRLSEKKDGKSGDAREAA